jgi:hypothetical protein
MNRRNLNLKVGDRVKTPCGFFGTVSRVYETHGEYAVDFDQGTPATVNNGNMFRSDGIQLYPSDGKAAWISPAAPSVSLGDTLYYGRNTVATVIATLDDGGCIIQVAQVSRPFRLDRNLRDNEGDVWSREAPSTAVYHNIYADGSVGNTAHKSFTAAQYASAYGKVRVGILKQTMRGDAVVDASVHATTPQLRTRTNPDGINPFA